MGDYFAVEKPALNICCEISSGCWVSKAVEIGLKHDVFKLSRRQKTTIAPSVELLR